MVAAEAVIVRLVRVIDEFPAPEIITPELVAAWDDCVAHGDFERGRKEQ